MRGTDARWYQWHLIRAGYTGIVNGTLDAYGTDGYGYGKTWDAIEAVTRAAGLGRGMAGAKTRAAVKAAAGF
jgi:hypothetical protein